MDRMLYISIGVLDSYENVQHVDAVRWTELFAGFCRIRENMTKLDCVDIARQVFDVHHAIELMEAANDIFVHHEACLKQLIEIVGPNVLSEMMKRKRFYLQADCLNWEWLNLNSNEYLPSFSRICVGNRFDALTRGLSHVPLACVKRRTIYSGDSDVVIYLGRFQEWFVEKTSHLLYKLRRDNMRLKVFTYQPDQRHLEKLLNRFDNLEVYSPISYGRLSDDLGHARFGLAFNNGPTPTGKVWDYLSLGVPVLFEEGISEDELILSENAGLSFPGTKIDLIDFSNSPALLNHDEVVSRNSWDSRAEQWSRFIC
jgi:hypothetical protein